MPRVTDDLRVHLQTQLATTSRYISAWRLTPKHQRHPLRQPCRSVPLRRIKLASHWENLRQRGLSTTASHSITAIIALRSALEEGGSACRSTMYLTLIFHPSLARCRWGRGAASSGPEIILSDLELRGGMDRQFPWAGLALKRHGPPSLAPSLASLACLARVLLGTWSHNCYFNYLKSK